MKNITLVLASFALSLSFMACGSSSSDKPATTTAPSTTWTDTAMQSLVLGSCAISGCHDGTETTNFKSMTQAQFKAYTPARDRVAAGTMPAAGFSSANKAKFATFYAN